MFAISFLKFILFLLLFLYLPAKALLIKLKVENEDPLIDVGLNLTVGITLLITSAILLRLIQLNYMFLWIVPVISILTLFSSSRFNKKLNFSAPFATKTVIFTITLGVFSQSLVLIRGGWSTNVGSVFPSLHDSMWNIALTGELLSHFPPQNPAVAGVSLKNNHYFYPLFLASAKLLTNIDIFDLYFRFGPVLISTLFGLSLYAISSIFTANIFFRSLYIFMGFFSGNFAYLLPLFLGYKFDWKGNSFFSDQPFDQLINAYSVFGFTLMLFGIYCLSKILKKDFRIFGYSVIGGILFGILYGFKSFGGVIVISSLLLGFIISVVIFRKFILLPVTLISLLLFTPIFLLITDVNSASMIWVPGWLLTQLMTDKDKLNLSYFADIEYFYQTAGNKLGLLKIKTMELVIYTVGNLGTRMVGLIYPFIVWFHRSKTNTFERKYLLLIIFLMIIISFSIPLLFNLKNGTFNIIQFTPYALVLLSIISIRVVESLYNLIARSNKFIGVFFIFGFTFLSILVNINNIADKIEMPQDMVSNEEIEALNYLNKNAKLEDVTLIDPRNFSLILINGKKFTQDPIYIPALSQRRVYLASKDFALQTGIDPRKRLNDINELFRFGADEFLARNNIKYIYLIKANLFDDQVNRLDVLGHKRVFENERVIIIKTAAV